MKANTIKHNIYNLLRISKNGGYLYKLKDSLDENKGGEGDDEDIYEDAIDANDIVINLDNIKTSFTLLKDKKISDYLDNLCEELDNNIFEKILITLIILIKSLIKLNNNENINSLLNNIENIIIFVYFLYLLEKDISLKIANSIMIIYQAFKGENSDDNIHNEGFLILVKFILILITIIIPGSNTTCEIDAHIMELKEKIIK
jgi:hypothetical protein